jgi:hypothetical protein
MVAAHQAAHIKENNRRHGFVSAKIVTFSPAAASIPANGINPALPKTFSIIGRTINNRCRTQLFLVRQSIAARRGVAQQTLMRETGERNVESLFVCPECVASATHQIKTWSKRYD